MKKNQLTQEQYDNLIRDIQWLEKEAIPANSDAIQRAREQGDLSENAEYHEAKDAHAKLHHELDTKKAQVANAEIIKESQDTSVVRIGHWVTFLREHNNIQETKRLKLIGQWDQKPSTISSDSLLGSSLIGKQVGDNFTISPPAGVVSITITLIETEQAQHG